MIQPIVEGHGDVPAVRILLPRIADRLGRAGLPVNRPIRRNRSDLVSEKGMRASIQLALRQRECRAILVLFDADDDCPLKKAPEILKWARDEAGRTPCSVVLAKREFEAWFIAGMEALRGKRGISGEAESHADPESKRGAKEYLEEWMPLDRGYAETADQPALTQMFDMNASYSKCRSFRKLVKDVHDLLDRLGEPVRPWTASEKR